jgi:menaquinol-cytochrome c reductase iron-sulfur subunit
LAEHDNREAQQPTDVQSQSRRRFLSFAAGAISTIIAGLIAVPLVGMFLGPLFTRRRELWLELGPLADAKPDQPTKFTYSYQKVDGWFTKTVYGTAYIVKGGNEFYALSNICTHLGCGVRWDPQRESFLCPCHGGVFNQSGNVISGPPPKPLSRFQTRLAGGRIQILIPEA